MYVDNFCRSIKTYRNQPVQLFRPILSETVATLIRSDRTLIKTQIECYKHFDSNIYLRSPIFIFRIKVYLYFVAVLNSDFFTSTGT
jgi:hypothetical protein